VHFYIKFVAAFGTLLLIYLKTFFEKLADFFNAWIDAVKVINKGLLFVIMNFDLTQMAGKVSAILPKITLNDVLEGPGFVKSTKINLELSAAYSIAEKLGRVDWMVQILLVGAILKVLFTPTPEMKDEPLLIPPGNLFPDISGLLGSGLG